jgi:hypothetical protein
MKDDLLAGARLLRLELDVICIRVRFGRAKGEPNGG